MMNYVLSFLKIAYMTQGLHSFMFEAGSLQTKVYIYTVNVPVQSMPNGFQSKVWFAHAADIICPF